MLPLSLILIFIFGSAIGSFLNVLILRLPKHETMGGRSHCPHCKKILTAGQLIPIFSYLFLRGKCAHCKARISPRYFFIEVTTGLLFILAWIVLDPVTWIDTLVLARAWLCIAVFIVIFVIDWEEYLILDKVVFPTAAIVLGFNILIDAAAGNALWSLSSYTTGGLVAALCAGLIFFSLWWFTRGKGMGMGDVKYVLLLGLIVGWPVIWICLMLSFFLGTLVSLPLLLTKRKQLASALPFGTFLSVAGAISLLFGQQILSWYWILVVNWR